MFWFFFSLFLAYLAYQVIFKLVIPIYRTTRQVKRTFRDMQERMQGQASTSNPYGTNTADSKPQRDNVGGDYIEFEEVK